MPDRLEALVEKLEAGDLITQSDVDRVATLQGLDAARQANEFLEEMLADEQEANHAIEQLAIAVVSPGAL